MADPHDRLPTVAWANIAPEEGEVYSVSLKREPYHDSALVLRSDALVAQVEAAAAEASIGHLSRLVDELRADSERLEWVLRRCHGSWLRAYLGVANDTGDMDELRTLIDANRGALSSAHGIKGDSHGAS